MGKANKGKFEKEYICLHLARYDSLVVYGLHPHIICIILKLEFEGNQIQTIVVDPKTSPNLIQTYCQNCEG